MSGPLELYRTTVNLRGLGVGTQIEIDPSDEGWAPDIRAKRIVPVERDGPAPDEWVEDWETGAIVDLVEPEKVSDWTLRSGNAMRLLPSHRSGPDDRLIDRPVDDDLRSAGQIDRDQMARDD